MTRRRTTTGDQRTEQQQQQQQFQPLAVQRHVGTPPNLNTALNILTFPKRPEHSSGSNGADGAAGRVLQFTPRQ